MLALLLPAGAATFVIVTVMVCAFATPVRLTTSLRASPVSIPLLLTPGRRRAPARRVVQLRARKEASAAGAAFDKDLALDSNVAGCPSCTAKAIPIASYCARAWAKTKSASEDVTERALEKAAQRRLS